MNRQIAAWALSFGLLVAGAQEGQFPPLVERRLKESQQSFQNGDYRLGANRLNEAADIFGSRHVGNVDSVTLLRGGTEWLWRESERLRQSGNSRAYAECVLASEPLLHALKSYEPMNPRWAYFLGILWLVKAGSGYNLEPLKLAIREFDRALSLPGNEPYQVGCQKFKTHCQNELGRRRADIANTLRNFTPIPPASTNSDKTCMRCNAYLGYSASGCGRCRDW